jgi:hypothetical protein
VIVQDANSHLAQKKSKVNNISMIMLGDCANNNCEKTALHDGI